MRTLTILLLTAACGFSQNDPDRKDWIQAFNGKDLNGWVMKITGFPPGENFGNTFRVENGLLKAAYDHYPAVGNRFGHLFYKTKFSHYIVAAGYRFVAGQSNARPT